MTPSGAPGLPHPPPEPPHRKSLPPLGTALRAPPRPAPPRHLGEAGVHAFLSHRALERQVAASTPNQALSAWLLLYRHVLHRPLDDLGEIGRAHRPRRLPGGLTREEGRAVLANLHGANRLVASLLYGAGLRLLEALRLPVKDLDLRQQQILVRDGKGQKDRARVLPGPLAEAHDRPLRKVKRLHEEALAGGMGTG